MIRPRFRVYVPTFNRRALLRQTLESLLEQTVSLQVVVIDNGSDDGSAAAGREFPGVEVLEPRANLGFGPALNYAVLRFPADYLVFANNDVRYEPRFVEALLDELGREEAMVAGVLLDHGQPGTIDSAGVVVDETLFAFDYLHGLPVRVADGAESPLGPTGGAALIPHTAFGAVGGFDERIFAYLEDVDLALRLRAAGIRCRLAPQARGIHRHSATLGSGSSAKNALMGWSRGYLLRRYGVLGHPRNWPRVLMTETVICAGQLIVDRNTSGISGRLSGWRAAKGLPRRMIPPGATLNLSLLEALRRRAARRRVAWSFARRGPR